QLKKLDAFIARRQEIAAMYTEAFKDVEGITVPKQLDDTASGWHLYMVQLETADRKRVFDTMRLANIGVHVHYIPVYWHPYYRNLGYEKGLCPLAEAWYEKALTLPVHPGLTDDEIEKVIKTLKKIIKNV
ncbi:MAG: DegT/DnrJ/EryC1/StrS family aminotransferase, partial [Lysinibacillus sp.]